MDQRFQAFIYVAETLSMSKAAEKAFVSHQCISGHIKSLEQEYKVSLFKRKPSLTLTAEGKKLLDTLYEIRLLENNIHNSLKGSHGKVIGKITLGLPMSRYSVMAVPIIKAFLNEYPNVALEILSDFSSSLELQVEQGCLDMAVTVQQNPAESLVTAITDTERFFCLMTKKLLKQTYPTTFSKKLAQFTNKITLEDLTPFPMIQYPQTSRLRCAMDRYAQKHGIKFNTVISSNRTEIFRRLTNELNAISLIPSMMFTLPEYSFEDTLKKNIYAFPIDISNLEIPLNISLIYHKGIYLPDYKKYIIEIITSLFNDYHNMPNY